MPKVVDADQRRSELADAAARVIARSGIDGTSLREVAAEAGWTTGALVHYFANKRELLAFTLQASLDRRRTRHADRVSMSPDEALRTTLRNALPTTTETTLHWIVTLAFAAQASADDELAAIQRDAYLHFRATISALVGGEIGPLDAAEHEAERLIALVNGIALQALFAPDLWTERRQLAALDAGMAVR
jgi:AcrR family transcriptional regulator